jgi:hypothetical protein
MERTIAERFFKEVEKESRKRIRIYDSDFILAIIEELEKNDIRYTRGILESKVADTEAYFLDLVEEKGWKVEFGIDKIIIRKGGNRDGI